MRRPHAWPPLLAALLWASPFAAAQTAPSDARVLLAVRGAGGQRMAVELAEACRVGLESQGFTVLLPASPPPPSAELAAEAARRGARFLVEGTVSGSDEVVIEAALTSVPDRALVTTVQLTGPARTGMERKGLRVAQELGTHMKSQAALPRQQPPGAVAAAPAPATAIAEAPPAAPAPAAAPAAPSPSATPGVLAPPPQQVVEERARMEQARARLRHELEESQRKRKKARVRAAVSWGAGAVALAGAGAAWYLAERAYAQYQDAEQSDEAVALREKTVMYQWIAIGAGAAGGALAVVGTIQWMTRPNVAPIERALEQLDGDPEH